MKTTDSASVTPVPSADSGRGGCVDRLRYLITILRLSQVEFGRRVEIAPSNLSKILNGRMGLSLKMIERIVRNTGVSYDWLVNGTDVPFPRTPSETPPTLTDDSQALAEVTEGTGAPVYDIDVTAGIAELSSMFTEDRIVGYLNVPALKTRHPLVHVSGNSMSPRINHGSYIQIRPVNDLQNIFWGNIYVVITDDYRMVKIIRRHQDPDKVILHSCNPDFDDMDLPLAAIRKLYLVETVLNYDVLL